MLLKQAVWRALARAWAKTGKRIAARMAMMAMTTSSSISVKPGCCPRRGSSQSDRDLLDISQPFLSVGTERGPEPRLLVGFPVDQEPSLNHGLVPHVSVGSSSSERQSD